MRWKYEMRLQRSLTDSEGKVDDMMAGLHEIRTRLSEEDSWLKNLHKTFEAKEGYSIFL